MPSNNALPRRVRCGLISLGGFFYSYCDDVPALRGYLIAEGIEAGPIKYPFYAPRGEFRLQDPDGYVIMVTQT